MKKVTDAARNIARGFLRPPIGKGVPLTRLSDADLLMLQNLLGGAACYAGATLRAADAAYLTRLDQRVRRVYRGRLNTGERRAA